MTKQLGQAFFGDKKYTQKLHERMSKSLNAEDITLVFQQYTTKLANIRSSEQCTLLDIFVEFMKGVSEEYWGWEFQKYSSILEIAAHVFEHSFEKWLTRDQSFKYFSEVVVRHSLFRPPHSQFIFTQGQIKKFTHFWIQNFVRYFEQYRECFSSELSEIMICHNLPFGAMVESSLGEKIVEKQKIENYLK